jgi:hypothetical protein
LPCPGRVRAFRRLLLWWSLPGGRPSNRDASKDDSPRSPGGRREGEAHDKPANRKHPDGRRASTPGELNLAVLPGIEPSTQGSPIRSRMSPSRAWWWYDEGSSPFEGAAHADRGERVTSPHPSASPSPCRSLSLISRSRRALYNPGFTSRPKRCSGVCCRRGRRRWRGRCRVGRAREAGGCMAGGAGGARRDTGGCGLVSQSPVQHEPFRTEILPIA